MSVTPYTLVLDHEEWFKERWLIEPSDYSYFRSSTIQLERTYSFKDELIATEFMLTFA